MDPLKAGLGISGPGGCSSNFIYRNSYGNPFLVTAGHCGTGTWYHNGVSIGQTSSNWLVNGSSADAQAISIITSEESNYLFATTSEWAHVTSRRASDYVGLPGCIQSWATVLTVGRSRGRQRP